MMDAGVVLVRPEEALQEKVRREKARRHLVEFSEYVSPWYRAARHHRLVAEYLELVETYIRTGGQTGISRLLIFQPPRHGKTEQVSKQFPAWVLGRNPDMRIIMASYGADLAVDNSRAVREIVKSERYMALFGGLSTIDAAVELSSDSRSVEAWDLAAPHRGGMRAAGVGGGITGKGAHILIVDDPFKNRQEAESEAKREEVWNWWTSSAYTRLEDHAAVIGMLTRWHGDDWAGRLLKAMGADLVGQLGAAALRTYADQYVVVCLPAIWEETEEEVNSIQYSVFRQEQLLNGVYAEKQDLMGRRPGQALWPEKYNEDDLARIEANIGAYDWAALYQQRPYLRKGGMFRRDWFAIVDEPPKEIAARIRYWDKAATEGGGAYTAGVLMCVTPDDIYYVEHVNRGQWSSYEREQAMLETAEIDQRRPGPTVETWHFQDPGSAGVDSAKATNQLMAKKGFISHYEPVTGDKETMAGPWSSMLQGGGVRLVRGGWNQAYIEEHVAFPKGKYKDQVDASAGAFNKLNGGRGHGIYA